MLLPFQHSLQLIVCDLWGSTFNTSKKWISILCPLCIDAFSRHTWIYFMNFKTDPFRAFQKFKTHMLKTI